MQHDKYCFGSRHKKSAKKERLARMIYDRYVKNADYRAAGEVAY